MTPARRWAGPGSSRVLAVPVALAVVLATLVALTVRPPSALAHGGAGEITVIDTTEVAPLEVDVTTEVRFVLDGHAASPATFVVSGTGPGDAILDPQQLERTDEEGVYEVSLTFPEAGRWTLTFQSSLPPGELDHELEVRGVAASATDDTSGTTAPTDATVAVPSSVAAEGTLVDDGNSGSGPPTSLVVGLVASGLLLLVAGVFVVRTLMRSRTD